jgi:selenide,water dikinase
VLERVLAKTEPFPDANVLVGFEKADDAGVYRLNDEMALVQTVDFFTPVVDDPFIYGQVSAANALSDVYAMGGTPLFALGILGFPEGTVDEEILGDIVRGGTDKMKEASVPVIGGHSIQDAEMKFGYCVTGKVRPGDVVTNAGACPGDVLVLTKPLGIGIITTGVKFGKASHEQVQAAIRVMLELNQVAGGLMTLHGAHAATDITGFGLVGHSYEMARASQVTLVFQCDAIPNIDGAVELAKKGMLPGGIMTNEGYVGEAVSWEGVTEVQKQIVLDPQTSGGLLISVEEETGKELLSELLEAGITAHCVGRVLPQEDVLIRFEE